MFRFGDVIRGDTYKTRRYMVVFNYDPLGQVDDVSLITCISNGLTRTPNPAGWELGLTDWATEARPETLIEKWED